MMNEEGERGKGNGIEDSLGRRKRKGKEERGMGQKIVWEDEREREKKTVKKREKKTGEERERGRNTERKKDKGR